MSNPTLVVMAAGMGTRYGGLKQLDPVGPNGETLLEYSIYDAIATGCDRIVFIIREAIAEAFRDTVGSRIESRVAVGYVFQELDRLPGGLRPPAPRKKPWGTGHAVLCCRGTVDTPFVVINADDFYGRQSFDLLGRFLKKGPSGGVDSVPDFAMAGFRLERTLSPHGHVARGICEVSEAGLLTRIVERTHIQRFGGAVRYRDADDAWHDIPGDSIASMNMWGFTPGLFDLLANQFEGFLSQHQYDPSAEFYLSEAVGRMIADNQARVEVLPTPEPWYGVTYREDKPAVENAIQDRVASGDYPVALWA